MQHLTTGDGIGSFSQGQMAMATLAQKIMALKKSDGERLRFDEFAARKLHCTPSYVRGVLSRNRASDERTRYKRTNNYMFNGVSSAAHRASGRARSRAKTLGYTAEEILLCGRLAYRLVILEAFASR